MTFIFYLLILFTSNIIYSQESKEEIETGSGKIEIGVMYSQGFNLENVQTYNLVGLTVKTYNPYLKGLNIVNFINLDYQHNINDNGNLGFLTISQGFSFNPYEIKIKRNDWRDEIIKLHVETHFGMSAGSYKNDNFYGLMGGMNLAIGYKPIIIKFGANYYTNIPIRRINNFSISYIF